MCVRAWHARGTVFGESLLQLSRSPHAPVQSTLVWNIPGPRSSRFCIGDRAIVSRSHNVSSWTRELDRPGYALRTSITFGDTSHTGRNFKADACQQLTRLVRLHRLLSSSELATSAKRRRQAMARSQSNRPDVAISRSQHTKCAWSNCDIHDTTKLLVIRDW